MKHLARTLVYNTGPKKMSSKVEIDLGLEPRYIYTDPDQKTYSPPTELVHMPELWKSVVESQEPSWARVCAQEALYQIGGPIRLVRFEVEQPEKFSALIETDSANYDDIPDEVVELYQGDPPYLIEILHALEQRVDTGIDGWQWAYGVNQRAPIEHPLMESYCVMVFSVTSFSIRARVNE